MRYISATDAKQKFAALLDAAQREPVTIRKQKRDVAVLVSAEDYERLCSHNAETFQRFCDQIAERAAKRGMTGKKLASLLANENA
ncbi:MAG: type II toxin-antitoxin system Phd/YefM family antitoxin [Alphaproteobacteria bacterium]|nr:type II toxin-antitoxin system Phd/YefM family antitoxin [Alphaproteobacteria bacterium]